jgi:putative membrane protein
MMQGGFGMFGGFMAIFWLAIILGSVLLFKSIFRQDRFDEQRPEKSAIEILRLRYAQGKIDKREYERMKKDILS